MSPTRDGTRPAGRAAPGGRRPRRHRPPLPRAHLGQGRRPVIPPRRDEAPVSCPAWIYTNRNRVERLWARLKEWRAVATRYKKTASSFAGVLHLAAALNWLRR